ncbi:MAG: hypothetical protein H6735_11850 [Alphaproteobacteria bacterium]|nr:hypothetical protein [Alphaproteobacteria bacterium]
MIAVLSLMGTAFATPGMVTNARTGLDYSSVSAAIAAASSGDVLRVDGVYDEHVVVDRNIVLDGHLAATSEITWEGAGNAILELNPGVSLGVVAVDLTSASRRAVGGLLGGNDVTLQALTISTVAASGNGGGLLLVDPTSVTITGVTFDHTAADAGGAVYVSNSSSFPMTITDTVFDHTDAGSGDGGALRLAYADLACVRCSFLGAAATNGGAIADSAGSAMTVVDSAFEGGSAVATGGAISLSSSSQLTVVRGSFCSNSATSGGAIGGAPSTVTVTASTFTNNSASFGSAISATGGSWTLANDDFLGHPGSAVLGQNLGTTLTLVNDLVADTLGTGVQGISSATITVRYSDFFGNSTDYSNVTANVGIYNEGPLLRYWVNDGDCSNDDLMPRWDSPLLDAGDPSPAFNDPDGSRSDIGAFGGPDADPAAHADNDNDGFTVVQDCGDDHASAHPGAPERCNLVDDDCDGVVDNDPINVDTFYQDCDGDGQGDIATATEGCFEPVGAPCAWVSYLRDGEDAWSDCDDDNELVFFGAQETCDPGDQNCDGDDDLGAYNAATFYVDADGDTWGDTPVRSCNVSPPPGSVTRDGDCNDNQSLIHPNAADPCGDGIDSDCNGADGDDATIRPWFPDTDGDGFGDPYALPQPDCSVTGPAGYTSLTLATDCDDTLDTVYPGAPEVCNLVDDDCDGTIDDVGGERTWYEDGDGDGYGDQRFPFVDDCAPEERWTEQGGDCDDLDADIHPGATETCNDVDDDCDGALDAEDGAVDAVTAWPDIDHDGFGGCPDGVPGCDPDPLCPDELDEDWADNDQDCNDGIAAINPAQEEIPNDDIDQDCDGIAQQDKVVEEDPGGCHCDSSDSPRGALALVGLLPLLVLRRRRG